MLLARPHVMHQIHLSRVPLVQSRVIQNQYPGGRTHLPHHFKPKCIVCWLKPVQQPSARIMRALNLNNRIGLLRFHRHRIHRRGDQKVDEFFSGNFRVVHTYKR